VSVARTLASMPLLWRVFATNAAVLIAATLALVLSPATVSFPVALAEVGVLAAGLAAMLALNLLLLRRAFGPLTRLTRFMRGVDPLRPGARVAVGGADLEVAELTAAFNEMIERLETERRESARAALGAQERERTRIARELHDEVGQALTAVLLQLERTSRRADAPVRDGLEEAREGLRASLEGVREIARRLRPEALDDLGLASALAALTNDVARRTGVRVERRVAGDLRALEPDEELVVYRVAQEALTNVARHSEALRAWVRLAGSGDGEVTLTVRDDGRGFDFAAHARGAGLRGMRERAVLIGASLDIESRPGHGTTVRLRLS
jgi:two-component system, NarL family, sensor histidine kinase UhpB